MSICFFSKPKGCSKRLDKASFSNRQLNAAQNKHREAKNNLRVFCTQKWKNLAASFDDRRKVQKKPRLKAEPSTSINIQNQHNDRPVYFSMGRWPFNPIMIIQSKACKSTRPEDKSFRQGVHGNRKNSYCSPPTILATQRYRLNFLSRAHLKSMLKAKILMWAGPKSGLKAKELIWARFFTYQKQVISQNKNPVVSTPRIRK